MGPQIRAEKKEKDDLKLRGRQRLKYSAVFQQNTTGK